MPQKMKFFRYWDSLSSASNIALCFHHLLHSRGEMCCASRFGAT
ncbi:unnamed protein product [Brassica oleracea var. botrytis]|uniref:(rape) hypothetical protein n=1 Tax=Brassica napus TaxID=3708 RepID=A0A816QWZ9_BRANA|nr:unnamed protein product [Brassica napus]